MCRKRRTGALPALPTILETIRSRDYFRRSFFVFTLNFTIGRLAVEQIRALLRRRRRSQRALAERK
jgi:hypothetical protein